MAVVVPSLPPVHCFFVEVYPMRHAVAAEFGGARRYRHLNYRRPDSRRRALSGAGGPDHRLWASRAGG